jgi:hypothetical protein
MNVRRKQLRLQIVRLLSGSFQENPSLFLVNKFIPLQSGRDAPERVEISGGFLSLGESALGRQLNTQLETFMSHQFNRVIVTMSHIDATIEELDGSIFYGR